MVDCLNGVVALGLIATGLCFGAGLVAGVGYIYALAISFVCLYLAMEYTWLWSCAWHDTISGDLCVRREELQKSLAPEGDGPEKYFQSLIERPYKKGVIAPSVLPSTSKKGYTPRFHANNDRALDKIESNYQLCRPSNSAPAYTL
jgi:hypothetical protein